MERENVHVHSCMRVGLHSGPLLNMLGLQTGVNSGPLQNFESKDVHMKRASVSVDKMPHVFSGVVPSIILS